MPWQSEMSWPALTSVNVYALGNAVFTVPKARRTSVRSLSGGPSGRKWVW